MAALMNATEQTGRQILLENSRRHADIGGMERGREWMGRQVEPTALEIVPHSDEYEASEFQLLGLIEALVQTTVVDRDRTLLNAPQQRDKTAPYSCE
jgi:hypothetical protein